MAAKGRSGIKQQKYTATKQLQIKWRIGCYGNQTFVKDNRIRFQLCIKRMKKRKSMRDKDSCFRGYVALIAIHYRSKHNLS